MKRRNPPAKWVLPNVVDPDRTLCITIHVPRERFHIAAFRGALLDLASAYKWQDDVAHTAKDVANVWKRVIDGVTVCPETPVTPDSGEEWSDCDDMAICQSLRFNNGKLQGFCCGEWVDIPGQGTTSVGGSGQPGGGAPQPDPGGGSQCYHGNMTARDEWLVPALVNAGDTVELTNVTGAGTDGSPGVWRCANGQVFFAGACIGVQTVTGTDPAAAVGHMRLVMQIDGTYYDAMAGAVTVPGGVTNAEVIIQVNDTSLSDNSGSYAFDVCVTNNEAAAWTHTINLSVTPSLFTSPGNGSYSPGVGFVDGLVDAGGSNYYRGVNLLMPTVTAFTLTRLQITCNSTLGANPQAVNLLSNPGLSLVYSVSNVGGVHTYDTGAVSITGCTGWEFDDSVGNAGSDPGGSLIISSLTISGIGHDPF